MPTPSVPPHVVRDTCRQLGLPDATVDALVAKLSTATTTVDPAACGEPATSRELEMMRLLNSRAPDKLVHDLRNVLNEVMLLRAMAEL